MKHRKRICKHIGFSKCPDKFAELKCPECNTIHQCGCKENMKGTKIHCEGYD